MENVRSGFLKLNARDLLRGALVTALTSVLFTLAASLNAGSLPVLSDLQSILVVGLSAGVSYLLKNLVTNSQGQIASTEPPAAPVAPTK